MIHPNVFVFNFLILLISGWVVAASLMAENTNVGMAVFIADITCVVSGRMELLPSFLRPRLSAAAAIVLCIRQAEIPCRLIKGLQNSNQYTPVLLLSPFSYIVVRHWSPTIAM